jgi:uncharacterized protein (TIGR00296 family)
MENNSIPTEKNSTDQYKTLCIFAFDVLISSLKKKDPSQLDFPSQFQEKEYPLFVTWSYGKEKLLRGCMGTFSSDILAKNLLLFAYYSAFKDSRFPPISIKEVPSLHCGISLLTNFEEVSSVHEWEVGIHGISIDFFALDGKKHHATFLPEVASDRNWDKKTTLYHLVKKSGYNGNFETIVESIKLTRYQSVKVGLSYEEYKEIKTKLEHFDMLV